MQICERYFETQAEEMRLQRQDSGLFDHTSATDILSIEFVENLLLVYDCSCSTCILLQVQNSWFIEELCLCIASWSLSQLSPLFNLELIHMPILVEVDLASESARWPY